LYLVLSVDITGADVWLCERCEGHLSFVWSQVTCWDVMSVLWNRRARRRLISASPKCHCQCSQVLL